MDAPSFGLFWGSDEFCDCRLRFAKVDNEDERVFPAHRIVLASKSAYYARLFRTDVGAGARTGTGNAKKRLRDNDVVIDVPEHSAKLRTHMLAVHEYLYSGRMELPDDDKDCWDALRGVLICADLLMVDRLVKHCVSMAQDLDTIQMNDAHDVLDDPRFNAMLKHANVALACFRGILAEASSVDASPNQCAMATSIVLRFVDSAEALYTKPPLLRLFAKMPISVVEQVIPQMKAAGEATVVLILDAWMTHWYANNKAATVTVKRAMELRAKDLVYMMHLNNHYLKRIRYDDFSWIQIDGGTLEIQEHFKTLRGPAVVCSLRSGRRAASWIIEVTEGGSPMYMDGFNFSLLRPQGGGDIVTIEARRCDPCVYGTAALSLIYLRQYDEQDRPDDVVHFWHDASTFVAYVCEPKRPAKVLLKCRPVAVVHTLLPPPVKRRLISLYPSAERAAIA